MLAPTYEALLCRFSYCVEQRSVIRFGLWLYLAFNFNKEEKQEFGYTSAAIMDRIEVSSSHSIDLEDIKYSPILAYIFKSVQN